MHRLSGICQLNKGLVGNPISEARLLTCDKATQATLRPLPADHTEMIRCLVTGGNHSEARKFAREARHLREKALKAHAQAAARIEETNNAGKGHDSWTLDLHGLHGTEAVAAVDRR